MWAGALARQLNYKQQMPSLRTIQGYFRDLINSLWDIQYTHATKVAEGHISRQRIVADGSPNGNG
jgi:hypothetical protein